MHRTWIEKLTASLLNDWLQRWRKLGTNLASSTGPAWTLNGLLELGSYEDTGQIELGYTSLTGSDELRLAIAQMHDLDPEWVVVTNGATEALHLIFAVVGKPGSNVLISSPCYPAVHAIAQMHRLSVVSYPLTRESHFKFDDQEILSLATVGTTALVVVTTPHNPTGAVADRSITSHLAKLLEARDIPLVVDEVFHPVYHGESVASLAGERNIILVGDLSKAFSLPGLRIGWIIEPDAERRSHYLRARGLMSLGGSPLLEQLAVKALNGRRQILQRATAAAARNLAELQHFMTRNSSILGWVRPRGGLVAFPWFHDGRDTRPFCEWLAANEVLLVPGDCFGMHECMRIGFGCEPATFDSALRVIQGKLGEL